MSAGHKHRTPNLFADRGKVQATLHRMLTTGHAPRLMLRWRHIDLDSDCPYLGGYNVGGTTKIVDRDFVRALYDPAYAEHLIGAAINTGLSPDDTLHCILTHEEVEKVLLDSPDIPFDFYDHHQDPNGFGAHEWATLAEHEQVRAKGGSPHAYEKGLEQITQYCAHKQLVRVPRDYACAALLDDADENAVRILRRLRELGVIDAFKTSKEKLDYSDGMRDRRCHNCDHWEGGHGRLLSTCQIAEGLVTAQRWCKKFEPTEKRDDAYSPRQNSAESNNGQDAKTHS